MPDVSGALQIYDRAIDYIRRAGLESEIAWLRRTRPDALSESSFLREVAWVVLCSGFREAVVRRVFDFVSLCYCDWESAAAISEAGPACVFSASAGFGHRAKLSALVDIARRIERVGFDSLKTDILCDPISTLRQFPFIGPITVWHLAKNLGFDAVKPDRHLVRVAGHFGFDHPDAFCAAIAQVSGDPVKVVDLVVWRFLADNSWISPHFQCRYPQAYPTNFRLTRRTRKSTVSL
jgi:hypothetical protein